MLILVKRPYVWIGVFFTSFFLSVVATGQALNADNQASINTEQTTAVSTPTDDRILRLLDIGNTMLIEGRYQQAFSHYQTFALQFPGNGPLMQALALVSRSADAKDKLLDSIKLWDGKDGSPTREMAVFVDAYIRLFDFAADMSEDELNQQLSDVRNDILTQGLNVQDSSNLQLLLAMISLRELDSSGNNLTQASQWIDAAAALDPRDPAITRLNRVIDYLLRGQALLDLKRPLANEEVAKAHLELGAIESSFLPSAIRERSARLIQTLVRQQDRDSSMPREYLRGLSNVVALSELGNDGLITASTTWSKGTEYDEFRRSPTFQEYGGFLGRYHACYANINDGLDILNRVQAIQHEYSDFSTEAGRATTERRLTTLVLLWRFATRARLTTEAKEYRSEAVQAAERLAQRSRRDLVDRPWLPIALGIGLILGITAFAFLLVRYIFPQRTVIYPQGRGEPPLGDVELQLRRKVAAVQARLATRQTLRVSLFVSCATVVGLLLAFLLMWAFFYYQPENYRALYSYTNTRVIAGLAIGGALFVGVLAGIVMANRRPPSAMRVASEIDKQLGLGGVAETIFSMDHMAEVSGRSNQSIYENSYLSAALPNAARAISPGRLVGFFWPVLLLILTLGISGAASASFQMLPLPTFDAIELPNPEICPPPHSPAHSPPPLARLEQPQPQGGEGDGQTGLDVTNSRVPEERIEELEKQSGVGGIDDVGEPFDYHTTLPSREFDTDRNSDIANGLGQADKVPDGFGGAARQDVPERFLGL